MGRLGDYHDTYVELPRERREGMVEPALKPGELVKCPECGIDFGCGVQSDDCWCREVLTKAVSETVGAHCLCFDCLTRRAYETSS